MTGRKGAGGGNAADGAPLPGEEAVARFCDHLASEMGASAHTVRAYREDMEAYLRWAQRAGVDPLAPTYRQLRRYLAEARPGALRPHHHQAAPVVSAHVLPLGVRDASPRPIPPACCRPPRSTGGLPKVVSDGDVERLHAVYGPTDADGAPREQTAAQMRDAALLEFLFSWRRPRLRGLRAPPFLGELPRARGEGVRQARQGAHRALEPPGRRGHGPLSREGAAGAARRQAERLLLRQQPGKPDEARRHPQDVQARSGHSGAGRVALAPCPAPLLRHRPSGGRRPICAASRTCWGTRASPPRRSTPM